jgi:hypothetical protein
MKQDRWINTKTQVEYGTNGALGSPRAWLRRALDAPTLDDVTFQPGSLTPHEISIAGIWYKPCSVPITGMYRELFRFFEIPAEHQIHRPRTLVPNVPAIGMCAAVPVSEVMKWLKVYREHGATYTWWNVPDERALRAVRPSPVVRRNTDHNQVYKLLDSGKTRRQISEIMDLPLANVDYIVGKWKKINVKA